MEGWPKAYIKDLQLVSIWTITVQFFSHFVIYEKNFSGTQPCDHLIMIIIIIITIIVTVIVIIIIIIIMVNSFLSWPNTQYTHFLLIKCR